MNKAYPFGKCQSKPIAKVECKSAGKRGFACHTHVERVYNLISQHGNTVTKYPPFNYPRGKCGRIEG